MKHNSIVNSLSQEMANSIIASKLEYLETMKQNPIVENISSSPPSNEESPPDVLTPGEANQHDSTTHKVALVIDGKTLGYALEQSLEMDFLKLAQQCHSVLCCRATPHQKVKCPVIAPSFDEGMFSC